MPCDYESTDYLPYVILGFYNRQIVALSRFEKLFTNMFFGDVPEGSFGRLGKDDTQIPWDSAGNFNCNI
ncbi:MAG: hypothetical protein E2O46_04190 [Ignavibacteria bacterium]|nr:MAG: hypothetical protein E2O46_04190 [Ignavibacteria bacterium]